MGRLRRVFTHKVLNLRQKRTPVVSTIKINDLAKTSETPANEKADETLRLGCIARRWVLRVWEG
jgi:hypothetical protein